MVAVAANRIAEHLETADVPDPKPTDLSAVWAGALFAAIGTLRKQLDHPNAKVAREAAVTLIDLEKTRLRHGRELAGVGPSVPLAERVVGSDPLAERAEHDAETERLLATATAYVEAVERGEIEYRGGVDDDEFDDDLDEEEEVEVIEPEPEPEPAPRRVSLAERYLAMKAARARGQTLGDQPLAPADPTPDASSLVVAGG